jgi:hypothetical protein
VVVNSVSSCNTRTRSCAGVSTPQRASCCSCCSC